MFPPLESVRVLYWPLLAPGRHMLQAYVNEGWTDGDTGNGCKEGCGSNHNVKINEFT